jgi:hypothetical protein
LSQDFDQVIPIATSWLIQGYETYANTMLDQPLNILIHCIRYFATMALVIYG